MMLKIQNIHASIEEKEILKGIDLQVEQGKVHAIMGPNGSGKSTLSHVIMGHPDYEVTDGDISIDGNSIMELEVDERSKKGLFLSFQYPQAVPGVTVNSFLRTAMNAHRSEEEKLSVPQANKLIIEQMEKLHIDPSFLHRYLNDGFSGGEKKRMEILQLAVLQPKFAILDETDSGTDVDALRIIAEGIKQIQQDSDMGVLLITHYERILHLLKPDQVSILYDGKIVDSAGPQLAAQIETDGYAKYQH